MLTDFAFGRRRVVRRLIFTAVYLQHSFVWPTQSQTLQEVIAGFEAAWALVGGVLAVVIPGNMKAIVVAADATNPRLNDTLPRVCPGRGFRGRSGRVRSPRDKPRVE